METIRALLLTLILVPAAAAAEIPGVTTLLAPMASDPMQVSVHKLSNGLTVYLSPNAQEPRVSAWIAVRAGSKNDPDDDTGIAHYLEHMLFKGSARLGTLDFGKEKAALGRITALYEERYRETDPKRREEIYRRIDEANKEAVTYAVPGELEKLYASLGFQGVNAFTSDERTVFVSDFPRNRAEVWARAEADRFSQPVFRLFQSELEAVYEEKNRSMDNPGTILEEALEKRLYKRHPYGQHTTLGTIEHLKNPSLKRMYEFYAAYYHPNNMAVALSGDFDRSETLALLEKQFGGWKPAELPSVKAWELPKPKGAERVEVKYEAEEQVAIAWPTVPLSHPDMDALTVMDMVLDNDQAGIVNLRLKQAQKVKNAGSYPGFHNDAGAWYLWALPKKGQTLEQAEALLLDMVEAVRNGEFGEEDLRAIVTDFEVGEKLKLESNGARVASMIDAFIAGEEWPRAAARLERLRKVTKADVVRVARQYLGPDRVVAYRRDGKPEIPSIAKPNFTKIDIDPSRHSRFFEELAHAAAPPIEPRWVKEGVDYEVRTLPWGKLYSSRNPMNDLFEVSLRVERGYKHDRQLCEALELLDLAGAGELDADAFKKKLYGLGAKMSVSCGEQEAGVELAGLDGNFEKSLELMFERFERPNVSSDTLKKMIEVKLGAHRDNKKNPGYVAYALGEYATRGKDSAVLQQLGDKELEALTLDGLVARIRSFLDYERKAVYIGVRSPDAAAPLLAAGRLVFKPVPAYEPVRHLEPAAPRVLLAHRDMVQSQFGCYAIDGVYDPRQAVDVQFYDAYMGGPSGVIWQEVREARSLAYSTGGGYSSGGRKGDENMLWAHAGSQADKTVEAATLLDGLLRKMPASEDRFSEAKKSIEAEYRTDPLRFRQIPGAVMAWEEQGLAPGDPRPERFERSRNYTLEDLRRFAKRFGEKPLTFYVLGPKDKLGIEGLKALGGVEEKKIDEIFPY